MKNAQQRTPSTTTWQHLTARWIAVRIVRVQKQISYALEKRIQKCNKTQQKAVLLLFVLTTSLYLAILLIQSVCGPPAVVNSLPSVWSPKSTYQSPSMPLRYTGHQQSCINP